MSEGAGALVGGVLGGRYRIEALIGQGGMGAVYRAEHVLMRKPVAVKVLHGEMSTMPEIVARFEREAVAAGRIQHPNVITATDFGRVDESGAFYLVLEYVEGQSLGALIKREGTLPEDRALCIARQIADALTAAHQKGIVHRDLKPENVMLVESEGRETVKVLDFGIAKVELGGAGSGETALTKLGTIFGTPEYMAPEQAQGLAVDGRADLYTLGLILYEMLEGRSPFRNAELVVVLTQQITMDPPPLPESISQGTRELVTALLKKDPSARPQRAAEVRERLDRLLESPPKSEEALTPPKSGEISGWIERQKPSLSAFTGRARELVLGRALTLGGRRVPHALVVGASVLLALALTLFVSRGSRLVTVPGGSASAAPERIEPDVRALVAGAEVGDRAALAELAERKPSKRGLLEWRALGHGWFRAGDPEAGLAQYTEALRVKPDLANDPILLADVRSVALHPELSTKALELAARSLGARGADLLYDVIDEQKNVTSSGAALRARALLEEEPAKSQRSPALIALFRLQAAMKRPKCSELLALLPDLERNADDRSLSLLTRLNERRGCGFLGLKDCYSCLRGGNLLKDALTAVKARPRPSFGNSVVPASSSSARALPQGVQKGSKR